ncbi:hypothetical protein [Rathayibacter rathayi]|uniref:XRE family transcriptional regulator n=1 Tax=Rathayibacter rathayi TaxID=33887 RepID=A0ABX5AAB8_RATRA|nr:hypothetical protein [Rathayibacter rathayi]MWV75910.1 hypothetical protein [Rathayibacter rathayi NCPPB 2980 = VKM Ac-1601]PPF23022.1 hypothetical protein C5C34_10230 [Rathayibacter rathayi]PPF44742.1 hypothetical protein C5C08_12965 [Rathayibacter rathayi]PPF77383.1 hypothetical protein C5C14_12645 [Rathayibacter rathayi]PPG11457.1 hypothetical protein C5C11_12455 [Rathayibacter rathayi]
MDHPEENRQRLARLLALLRDAEELTKGRRSEFAEVSAFLADRGVTLLRSRWQYMLSGSRRSVTDPRLFAGLAEFYGVDVAAFSATSPPVPPELDELLPQILEMRRRDLQVMAARMFDGVSPDVSRRISEALTNERPIESDPFSER